jgi:hypothetical protein
MNRRPGTGRVLRMRKATRTAPQDIRVRLGRQNTRSDSPLTLWTDFLVAGGRVYIRTHRPARPLGGLGTLADK